jgi:hypothetical protein
MLRLAHNSWQREWRGYRQLAPESRGLFWRAWVLLALTNIGLRVLGFRRWKALLERNSERDCRRGALPTTDAMMHAERIARAVRSAALRKRPSPSCLQRSVVLWYLLRRRGLPADLCIGGRRGEAGFEAHAWVEYAGLALNNGGDTHEGYARFGNAEASAAERQG